MGSSTTASSSFKGSTSVSFSANLGKGTYYLRFEQENYGATCDSFRHLHSTLLDLNSIVVAKTRSSRKNLHSTILDLNKDYAHKISNLN